MAHDTGSRATAPEQRIGFLIYRAGLAVAQVYEQMMRPAGFTPGEVGVLTQLDSHGASHIRQIARALGVSPQTVVNLARSLTAKDMVSRTGATSDRRTVILDITDQGREALSQADRIACRLDDTIAELASGDAASVVRALRTLLSEPERWAKL